MWFVFFKRNTEYGRVISDWSSYVFSSDLGVGQALYEHFVYDADGQLLTGSFTDYCMPRAEDEEARDTAIAARLVDPAVLAARAEAGARHGAAEIGRASGRERVGK